MDFISFLMFAARKFLTSEGLLILDLKSFWEEVWLYLSREKVKKH